MLDRRSFLQSAAAVTAALLLPGCSRGPTKGLQVFPGAGDFVLGRAQRVPFGLLDPQGNPIEAADARVRFSAANGSGAGEQIRAPFRRYGHALPHEPKGFYVARGRLDHATTRIHVEADGYEGEAFVDVRERAQAPDVDTRAIRVETPVTGNLRGVQNLCTLVPACPMHEVSLADVIGKGAPVVFVIASPKLCTSRTCGPVLQEVVEVRAAAQGRARFVHIEPYARDEATELSAAAQEWHIPSEPWVFVIDGAGTIRARFEGPITAAEITPALTAL